MQTYISKTVQNEIKAINEQEQKTVTKKRINVELICALLTLGAIVLTVYILDANGFIREF